MHLSDGSQRDSSGLKWVRSGPLGGETVVLIHPVGYDLTYWSEQVDALAPFYDVVTFNLPGHGGSGAEAGALTFAAICEQVAQLIDSLGKGAAHVVGISVGGMIAQSLALAYPQKVRSLCLIGTACTFSEGVRAGMRARAEAVEKGGMAAVLQSSLERWFTPHTRTHRPELMQRVSATMLANSPEVHAAMWRMIATFEVRARLHEIRCPTLVVVGDLDPSTPVAAAEVLVQNIAGAELVVLAHTSHIAMLESPAAVNAALLGFLRRVG